MVNDEVAAVNGNSLLFSVIYLNTLGVSTSSGHSMASGIGNDLGAILQVQVIQDLRHVVLDCPLRDADCPSHLPVGLPLSHQGQDLYLPRC